VAVKIKLKRMGKIRSPYYRIVIADSRTKRDGRAIEEIGKYHPTEEPSLIQVDSERVQYWLSVGAQPTDAVAALLRVTGDWQRFKGLPGVEGTLRVAGPRPDKKAAFNEAAREALGEEGASDKGQARQGAAAQRGKKPQTASARGATEAAPAQVTADEAATAETPPTETVTAEPATAETAAAETAPAEAAPATGAAAEGTTVEGSPGEGAAAEASTGEPAERTESTEA
jgi:small subunit ribosomal protein S16